MTYVVRGKLHGINSHFEPWRLIMKKWVYNFEEVTAAEKYTGSWDGVRSLLGGKGAGLFDMTRAGVPVPPGFTVTTSARPASSLPDSGNRCSLH